MRYGQRYSVYCWQPSLRRAALDITETHVNMLL